jgi:hypothetical protein
MSEKPKKRAWLQFHLSTGLLLMFVAAGLLWLNMKRTFEEDPAQPPYFAHFGAVHRGWPLRAVRYDAQLWVAADYQERRPEVSAKIRALSTITEDGFPLEGQGFVIVAGRLEVMWTGLAADIVIASVTIFGTGVLTERRIRRGERRP